ncbi:hypothetical protein GUJ93_ZPchr0006g42539 [Zizania palustris]|uniref:Uncharacterized protein n=1 Tax=Zizania palustris TaxID=103762 RepID=A0A8J5T1U2_ZIZPA|nr:hypothetical protein GUJ93_ZPchr0006g42539 [Zizania palustris]
MAGEPPPVSLVFSFSSPMTSSSPFPVAPPPCGLGTVTTGGWPPSAMAGSATPPPGSDIEAARSGAAGLPRPDSLPPAFLRLASTSAWPDPPSPASLRPASPPAWPDPPPPLPPRPDAKPGRLDLASPASLSLPPASLRPLGTATPSPATAMAWPTMGGPLLLPPASLRPLGRSRPFPPPRPWPGRPWVGRRPSPRRGLGLAGPGRAAWSPAPARCCYCRHLAPCRATAAGIPYQG